MESQSTSTRRLVRRSHDCYLGGVAGGVADYFGVDPVLVRSLFVVFTFVGGAGAIAYLAGWLLIPEEGTGTSVGAGALHEHNWTKVGGLVLILVAASLLVRPWWWFGGHLLTATVLILAGVYLLWFHGDGDTHDGDTHDGDTHDGGAQDGDLAPPPTPPPPASAPPPVATAVAPPPVTTVLAPPPPPRPPLAPVAPAPSARRRGRGPGSVTFGLLLVGAGVAGLVAASGHSIDPVRMFAAGLVLVGAVLVAGAWFGRAGGLIPLGLVLVVGLSASSLVDVPFEGGFGNRTERPTTPAAVDHEYRLAVGQLTVDLRDVHLAAGSHLDVDASVGIGHLVVIVPRNVEVDVHGHAGAGVVRFLDDDNHDGGVHVDRDARLNAASGAPTIVLDAGVGIGQVEVRDAAS